MARRRVSAYIETMEKQIPLSMKGSDQNGPGTGPQAGAPEEYSELKDYPVIGYLAVICGVLAIFTWGIVFVPMSMAFAIAAMIAGQGAWGFSGLVLGMIGLMTSPTLLALLGLGAVAAFFGIG